MYQSVSWQKTDGTDGTLTELIDKVNEKTIHNTTESVKKPTTVVMTPWPEVGFARTASMEKGLLYRAWLKVHKHAEPCPAERDGA